MILKYICAIALLCIISTSLSANEDKLQKVSLQLQWKHQFEFAGFYMAQEKGFYKDLGIDVEFIEFNENIDVVDSVTSGKAQYGLGYSSIIVDYLNDKPIVFVANFFKQSPLVLITQKEITSLSQLKDSKIEGLANNIDNITLYTMLDKFGISDKDIQTLPPSFSVDAFINKDVDAMSVFITNELFLLEESGVEYNIFSPVTYGAKYYDANLFTSQQESVEHSPRVEKFRDASIRGWEYALLHKEEAVQLILKKYNTQNKSKKALLFEAKQIEQIMLTKVHKIGSIDNDKVEIIADNFKQSGFVDTKKVFDIDKFIFKAKEENNILSLEEKKYLKEKEYITACVDPNWMPFSAIVDAKYIGVDADFLELFGQKLGIPIEIYHTKSWSQSVGFAKAKKCDILSMLVQTREKKKFLNFTKAYTNFTNVLITRTNKPILTDMKNLKNEKIAIVRDYGEVELMRDKYPNLEVFEVENMKEGFAKVSSGEVYGFIDNAFTIDYFFQTEDNLHFKIGNYFNEKKSLHLGVRDDDVKLHSILQKVVQSLSEEEKQKIRDKWLGLEYEERSDYTVVYQILGISFIVFLFIAMRIYYVKQSNTQLKIKVAKELEKAKAKDKVMFHQSKLVAMGEMIENIAHQWRQPLSQVNSCVLVIDDILDVKDIHDKELEDKLLEIESLTKYMSRTIEDFKNFFDQNKEKEYFYIEEVLDRSLEVLSGKIASNKIEIVRGLATEHNCYGYPSELQQVFISILNNAIDTIHEKERSKGKITIKINAISSVNTITISDNAGGIPEDLHNKIFEPYYTTKHKSQGTGLGLYISKLIVEESLGGALSVKNNFHGATFTIKLEAVEIIREGK
ncbi:MAG: signal transduction histidine kinase/ABC-type nitrate/sulfonate [Sulfurimonas sp.]|jgi:signal transduction histidine kinase/ABC-type nitrate/sulfonate/bicarbonate transport system substrate-binding protein|uniref:ABC transporter substrate-binding protein n=1 Tax=Sulfurimonas sp. TaxID=2022749 RepID=UPI0039E25997